MTQVILIAHNLRSTHNIGSLLRTADGLGVQEVILSGYSPYPLLANNDPRLPHLANKLTKQISKTALGAENYIAWHHSLNIEKEVYYLKTKENYTIIALEQSKNSVKLPNYHPPKKLALIVGREEAGLENEILSLCDLIIEIPMLGQKESFNVVQAAAMALYHVRYL